ncbi:MAG: glycoside hydrolase family 3 protein [Planctomycetes bacterium]|nr:glycoside hydrolase family 3 protein [Planctomycetota bacterium]
MATRTGLPFLFGLYGIEPLPDTIKLLRESGACGVLLHRRNIESGEQVRALVKALEEGAGHPILAAVEHEGGLVTRFARDVTPLPGNLALGRTGTASLACEVGKSMARELIPIGISMNLAPLLDTDPALNLRSFGDDPEQAALMGTEMIRGMQELGLSAAAKHFPGRGKDGHTAGALAPFRAAVEKGVDAVVTSHAIHPALDPQPATFSRAVVHDLLRGTCGFRGVAMTDDLATAPGATIEEAVVRAAVAGHDVLVVAQHTDMMTRAWNAYRQALEKGRLDMDAVEESRRRIENLLRRHSAHPASVSSDDESDPRALSEIIAGAAVRIERDLLRLIPVPRGRRTGILFPRLTDVGDRIVVDDDLRGVVEMMRSWVQEVSKSVDILEIPVEPRADLFAMTLEWCCALELVIVFSFDAQAHPGHRRVLEEVQRQCRRVILVPIRNPEDREFAGPKASVVQTYGFRMPQLAAAVDLIFRGAGT